MIIMKKVFLLCIIALMCIGIVFAQDTEQKDNEEPVYVDEKIVSQPDEQIIPTEVYGAAEPMLIAYDTNAEECSCECENKGTGQPMQQGYVPMGQEMKDDDEQGQPQEQGYVPMGQEMKDDSEEEQEGIYFGTDEETQTCDVEKFESRIKQLEAFITANNLEVPAYEYPETAEIVAESTEETTEKDNEQSTEKEEDKQSTEQEKQGQNNQNMGQKVGGFFKKMFGFFQKSPEMTQQTGEQPPEQINEQPAEGTTEQVN